MTSHPIGDRLVASQVDGHISTPLKPAVLRCLIADDHPGIVGVVRRYLADDPDFDVVGCASDGKTATWLIAEEQPDIALLDIMMPAPDGISIARELIAQGSVTETILFTGEVDRVKLDEALVVGSRGFVLKDSPLIDLKRAIREVAAGNVYIDPALAYCLLAPEAAARPPEVTVRERQVLTMLADGRSVVDIARDLSISAMTVRSHVRKATAKLEAGTRTQAVASALRQALIA